MLFQFVLRSGLMEAVPLRTLVARPLKRSAGRESCDSEALPPSLTSCGCMFRCWEPQWGWVPCAPTPWLLLSLLVCAAPFGLQGEETRQVRALGTEVIDGSGNPTFLG